MSEADRTPDHAVGDSVGPAPTRPRRRRWAALLVVLGARSAFAGERLDAVREMARTFADPDRTEADRWAAWRHAKTLLDRQPEPYPPKDREDYVAAWNDYRRIEARIAVMLQPEATHALDELARRVKQDGESDVAALTASWRAARDLVDATPKEGPVRDLLPQLAALLAPILEPDAYAALVRLDEVTRADTKAAWRKRWQAYLDAKDALAAASDDGPTAVLYAGLQPQVADALRRGGVPLSGILVGVLGALILWGGFFVCLRIAMKKDPSAGTPLDEDETWPLRPESDGEAD